MDSIAIQGTRGSYSEEAAARICGESAKIREFPSFFRTFEALLLKTVDYAVVPVKNTLIGDIKSAKDFLDQTDLHTHEKLSLEIRHVLVGTKSSELRDIRSARSHIEALRQCRGFFRKHRTVQPVVGADTASSIKRVIEEQIPENAAIGSLRAARLYGGKVLLKDLAGSAINKTTFYLVGN